MLCLEHLVGVLRKELVLENIMWDRQWSREGWGEHVDLVALHMSFSFDGFKVCFLSKTQFIH